MCNVVVGVRVKVWQVFSTFLSKRWHQLSWVLKGEPAAYKGKERDALGLVRILSRGF